MINDKNCGCSNDNTFVGCDVISCKYHGSDNLCQAKCIKVESKNAQMCAETYCSTYCSK